MAEPSVCVKVLRAPFFAAAVKTSRPIPELAARFEIAPALLTDLAARVPHALAVRVWDALAALCQDAGFGLTVAALVGAPQLDLVDLMLQRAASPRALTASFVRYQRLFHDANAVSFHDEGDEFVVRHRFAGELARSRHLTEFVLAMWVSRLRSVLGGARLPVRRVCFRHEAPAGPTAHAALFDAPVTFGAVADALVLPQALMDQALPAADPATARALEDQLQAELAGAAAASFPEAVRAHVAALIRAGSSDAFAIDRLARRMTVSRRTLQRRLADEGTSFRDVVDAARREVALAALAAGGSSVTDLAFLLGFSEHSAFCRAFRRWTGTSPGLYLKSA